MLVSSIARFDTSDRITSESSSYRLRNHAFSGDNNNISAFINGNRKKSFCLLSKKFADKLVYLQEKLPSGNCNRKYLDIII